MFSKGSQEGRYSGCARRVSVLNKLFMKHITDLLSTGEYSSEFSGYGIEINRVKNVNDLAFTHNNFIFQLGTNFT
jgi:hypothetical protein